MLSLKRGKEKEEGKWIAVEYTYQITNAPRKLRKRATARYLDFFQLNRSLNTKMKGKTTVEYIGRFKKLCRSKLNVEKRINGINAWAVGVVAYSAGIMDLTVEELVSMGRKTWKILAMNCVIYTSSNVGRLYLPIKGGGRLTDISVCDVIKNENKNKL